MKSFLYVALLLFSMSTIAQDAVGTIRAAEDKAYNPRAKGLTDLVVDLVNPQITKQLNDQMIFGRLNEVVFRIYWTASPERIAIDIIGLPEGFREIKEELKGVMVGRLETIIPIPLEKKFQGYQFRINPKQPKTILATDQSHLLPIPEYELIFDQDGKLSETIAKKPIGISSTKFTWAKANWSEPRFYVTDVISKSEEGPQSTESLSTTTWQIVAGMGLPSVIKTKAKQVLRQPGANVKPVERTVEDTLYFKNYKVNVGEAMKWFLGHSTAAP